MSDALPTPRWRILLTPRWIGWHLFIIVAIAAMMLLGYWQFRRAEAGNTLSWAYTFEWPIFSVFALVFWIKTIKDELSPPGQAAAARDEMWLPAGASEPPPSWELDTGAAGPKPPAAAAGEQDAGTELAGTELAEYNEYLARLNQEVRSTHGKWHRSQ